MQKYEHFAPAKGFMKYSEITTINGREARYGIFVQRTDIRTTLRMIVFERSGCRSQLLWHDEENADTSVWGKGVYQAAPMPESLGLKKARC